MHSYIPRSEKSARSTWRCEVILVRPVVGFSCGWLLVRFTLRSVASNLPPFFQFKDGPGRPRAMHIIITGEDSFTVITEWADWTTGGTGEEEKVERELLIEVSNMVIFKARACGSDETLVVEYVDSNTTAIIYSSWWYLETYKGDWWKAWWGAKLSFRQQLFSLTRIEVMKSKQTVIMRNLILNLSLFIESSFVIQCVLGYTVASLAVVTRALTCIATPWPRLFFWEKGTARLNYIRWRTKEGNLSRKGLLTQRTEQNYC